ncbi:MAG: hypothetical protein MR455_06840 [Prevotella sp.]|nr:hypothetical protein [Prevotella sp.]
MRHPPYTKFQTDDYHLFTNLPIFDFQKDTNCTAKPALLPAERAGFGVQKGRFCRESVVEPETICSTADRMACQSAENFARTMAIQDDRQDGDKQPISGQEVLSST